MYRNLLLFFSLILVNNAAYSASVEKRAYDQIIHLGAVNAEEIAANNFFVEAEKSEKSGKYNDALTLYGKAANVYNKAKLKNRYAATLIKMSHIYRLLKNFRVAEDVVLNVVLRTYAKLGNKTGEMNSYQELGKIYLDAGRFTESLWFFTQQGILAQQTSNKHSYIESVLDIARLKIKKREYSLATADLNRAEILAKNANTTQFQAQISGIRKDLKERS